MSHTSYILLSAGRHQRPPRMHTHAYICIHMHTHVYTCTRMHNSGWLQRSRLFNPQPRAGGLCDQHPRRGPPPAAPSQAERLWTCGSVQTQRARTPAGLRPTAPPDPARRRGWVVSHTPRPRPLQHFRARRSWVAGLAAVRRGRFERHLPGDGAPPRRRPARGGQLRCLGPA